MDKRTTANNNNCTQQTTAYEAPTVRMVEVHVEKGFAVSDVYGEGDDMPIN